MSGFPILYVAPCIILYTVTIYLPFTISMKHWCVDKWIVMAIWDMLYCRSSSMSVINDDNINCMWSLGQYLKTGHEAFVCAYSFVPQIIILSAYLIKNKNWMLKVQPNGGYYNRELRTEIIKAVFLLHRIVVQHIH